jgi:hypothetical protein
MCPAVYEGTFECLLTVRIIDIYIVLLIALLLMLVRGEEVNAASALVLVVGLSDSCMAGFLPASIKTIPSPLLPLGTKQVTTGFDNSHLYRPS